MDFNITVLTESETSIPSVNYNTHLINLILSSSGVVTNLILLTFLLYLARHRCTTYFLLTLMTVFDFIYCLVYLSILLTNQSYLNLINHQILCPLSFFLSLFTFTGSILILFICLIHLITHYVRRYNTFLGQITGRLSIVFVFAFILIRSVLGSTSIELVSDPSISDIKYCTVDMNTPEIVSKVQNFNQIFAEVTDILVYIGWIVMLIHYFFSLINCQKSNAFYSIFFLKISSKTAEQHLMNSHRHRHVSLIIITITIFSIICFLPVMINKLVSMIYIYLNPTIFYTEHIIFLQMIHQTTHLFCLAIRCIPYFLFDQQMRSCLTKCIPFRFPSKSKTKQTLDKYLCYCQCSRPEQVIDLNLNKQTLIDV